MNYVKSCLIITMLLGALYSQDCGDGICDIAAFEFDSCPEDCAQCGCDLGFIQDCSGDGDCCGESRIGDGHTDCENQIWGCDLTCYDNDGDDCTGYSSDVCNESNWQEYYPNMEGCWLQGATLRGVDLTGANLSGADLSLTLLAHSTFEGANLSGANLTGADLSNADLSGANLTNTACWGAYFVGANLDGTIFDGAELNYTYFDEDLDYYDDVSYDAGATSGDLNLDGADDVLDVVILVDNILNP